MNSNLRSFQVIDEKAEFKFILFFIYYIRDGIKQIINRNQLNWTRDYQIISVIGAQSSGNNLICKSTLLNSLFGTMFEVLDHRKHRTQVTQGVWIQKDIEEEILILDVEGSDSTKRWEDVKFENFVTLFALTLSNILLVNIWTTEVGRFNSSQYQLLKNAIMLNIRLWKVETTKQVIFVLRDFQQDENFSFIQQQINFDLNKIWQEIQKPPQMQRLQLTEVFQIQILTLPSKIYQEQYFIREIQVMRVRLLDLLRKNKQMNKQLQCQTPLDGLDIFAFSVWKTILNEEELNIPQTRIMISLIKCEKISEQLIDQFKSNIGGINFQGITESQVQLNKFKVEVFDQFDRMTIYYNQEVVNSQRDKLWGQLQIIFENFIVQYMEQIKLNLQEHLNQRMMEIVRTERQQVNIQNLLEQNVIEFERNMSLFSFCLSNSYINKAVQNYNKSLNLYVQTFQEQLIENFLNDQSHEYQRQVDTLVESCFKEFDEFFIQRIIDQSQVLKQQILQNYQKMRDKFSLKIIQNTFIQQKEWFSYENRAIQKRLPELHIYAYNKFLLLFKSNGKIPKIWRQYTEDQIRQFYEESLLSVIKTLSAIKALNLDVVKNLQEDLKKQAQKDLVDALRQKNFDEQNKIKFIYWAVLLFLMYDNIIAWCYSPLFVSVLLIFLSFYVILLASGHGKLVTYGFNLIQFSVNSIFYKIWKQF